MTEQGRTHYADEQTLERMAQLERELTEALHLIAALRADLREMARTVLARSSQPVVTYRCSWGHAMGPDLIALARKYAEEVEG